jgi:hypothetical protein
MSLRIKIIQSCDASGESMLDVTSEINSLYANKFNFIYEKFVGKKSVANGIYNVIYHLQEEINSNSFDYLLLLDSDAFIFDQDVNLLSELCIPNEDYALICSAGSLTGGNTWDINAGVLLFNLKHASTQTISNTWKTNLETDMENVEWNGEHSTGHRPDQAYLIVSLAGISSNNSSQCSTFVKRYNEDQLNYINYEGSLIRHVLDDQHGDSTWTGYSFEQRLELVKQWTTEIKEKSYSL